MPVHKVKGTKDCYQWGNQKVYCGKDARKKAEQQGQAVRASGWKEKQRKGK